MIRTAAKILGSIVVLAVVTGVLLDLTAKPVTRKEAEKMAIEEVRRSAQQLRFDASIFEGPKLIDEQEGAYAFQWRFSDQVGTVKMLVWVEKYGGTEISWWGDLERLQDP
jgi:hypothetical protein